MEGSHMHLKFTGFFIVFEILKSFIKLLSLNGERSIFECISPVMRVLIQYSWEEFSWLDNVERFPGVIELADKWSIDCVLVIQVLRCLHIVWFFDGDRLKECWLIAPLWTPHQFSLLRKRKLHGWKNLSLRLFVFWLFKLVESLYLFLELAIKFLIVKSPHMYVSSF